MLDRERLVKQVRYNCDVSDAQYAGIFSICGLALRLRDLYKWENGLAAWQEGEPAAVLDWIGSREQHWESLAEAEFRALEMQGGRFDPFETEAVNAVLEPHGLYYGAGHARGLKPTFFLARIETMETLEGFQVYRLGEELARDLLTLPALSQENSILLRRESARLFLWDQIITVARSGRRALSAALDACGLHDHRPAALKARLDELLRVQDTIFLHHELGELQAEGFDRSLWQEIVAALPLTRVELFARRIKDLLADTHSSGTLPYVCHTRDRAALSLFMAFLESMTKTLAPPLATGFEAFLSSGDWGVVEDAVQRSHALARRYANTLIDAYRDGKAHQSLEQTALGIDQALKRLIDAA
jgi:hypothetical protein